MFPPCVCFKMADIRVNFVSKKISKIRWKPSYNQSLQQSNVFASGSWDDEENELALWQIPGSGDEVGGDFDYETDTEPKLLCQVPHVGDVTDLEFASIDQLVAASSTGTVTLYRHHKNTKDQHGMKQTQQWSGIHGDPGGRGCPCTCVATQGEDMVVSAGEDGRINVLNVSHRKPVRTIAKADSSTINSITFLKQLEVITINSSGQLKIYDLRHTSDDPTRILSVSGEPTALQCVANHPSQMHIVAAGGQDGVLSIWDLRQEKFPVTLLEAHSSTMWEVKFHRNNPDHMFTCSEDGTVWHWDTSAVSSLVTGTGAGSGGGSLFAPHVPTSGASVGVPCPWLSLETGRSKLEITALLPAQTLPVNTLDIESHTLVCGSDEEAIYTVDIPGIR